MSLLKVRHGEKWERGIITYCLLVCMVFSCIIAMPSASYAADDNAWEQNGIGLSELTPEKVVVFAGNTMNASKMGFLKNYYYLSEENLNDLRQYDNGTRAYGYFGEEAWISNASYSSSDDHGAREWRYSCLTGIDLEKAFTGLGVTPSTGLSLKVKSTDGTSFVLENAFDQSRYYFNPQGEQSTTAVAPILALKKSTVSSTIAPSSEATVVVPTTAADTYDPLFAYGKKEVNEDNNCHFVKYVNSIVAGTEDIALTVIEDGKSENQISISEIIRKGVYKTNYSYSSGGSLHNHSVTGIPLAALLNAMGVCVADGQSIQPATSDNYAANAISQADIDKWFVAYDALENGSQVTNNTILRLYGPGQFGNQVLVKNLSTLTITGQSAAVSKTALTDAIKAANTKYMNATEGLEAGQYAVGSKAAFKTAIDTAQAVADNAEATQAQVNQAVTDLKTAEGVFDAAKVTAVSKTALTDAIKAANTKYTNAVEGSAAGQYALGSKAALKTAIDTAQAVADNTEATQAQVNQAVTDLKAAEGIFDAAKVTDGKAAGGDTENAVFYIAVKESADSTAKYYYYTKAELEAYETTEDFLYNDHSVIKTVTAKGALLSDLLYNLNGVTITGDMIIQYAESDGYHADRATSIDNSSYKDKIAWLTAPHYNGSNTIEAARTVIAYGIHEEYLNPDENNINDAPGVFKDADKGSGYLRAYRETGSGKNDANIGGANATVIKYLMGVVVSYDGAQFTGKDGYTLKAVSAKNPDLAIVADQKVTGLMPGMEFAVKAPRVVNSVLASGEPAFQKITVGTGASQTVSFKYTENPYFYVTNGSSTTNYTYTDLVKTSVQLPSKDENQAPYGYSRPMYYRYNGAWLADIIGSALMNDTAVTGFNIIGKDGKKTFVSKADVAQYFVAYNNTQSKTSTNIPEGKRVTRTYEDAKIIIPGQGENITGSAADDYTTAGKDVGVLVAAAEGVEASSAGGGSGGGGGSSGGGGSVSTSSGQQVQSSGATVTKNGVVVVIPSGAVSSGIYVHVAIVSSSGLTVDSGSKLISDVYEITKDKEGNFAKDITVTLPFTKSKADQSKDELTICFWNGSKWVELDNVKVDWSTGTVSGTINHFTKFAVLAKKKESAAVPIISQPAANQTVLTDINGHWAAESIRNMLGIGILSGYPDGTFKPDQTITRAEFASMLAKAFKLSASGNKVFDDTAGHWAQDYIAAASDAGIVSGFNNNNFEPDEPITREQMAVMVTKAAKAGKPTQAISFKDKNDISVWAQEAVASAVSAQVLSGYPDQTFRPKNNANRAEAASVLTKALNLK